MTDTTAPPPTAPPAPPPSRPPLRRSSTDRKIGGVAGGIARHLDVDPLLVRIAFVVITLCGAGVGLLLYLACWVLVPADDGSAAGRHFVDRHGRALAITAGVVVGIALLSGPLFSDRRPTIGIVAVVVAATLGVVWLVRGDRRGEAGRTPPAPTIPNAAPPYATTPYGAAPYGTAPYASGYPPPATLDPAWKPRERSALGPITFGAALLVAGVLVALDRANAVDVPAVVVLGSALGVVGVGLVVGAFVGRARGLIVLGVLLTLATMLTSAVHLPGNRQAGDQVWAPATAAQVEPLYEWGAGDTMLDLRSVTSTEPVSTRVELGIGQVVVDVPRDAVVRLHAHVGAGAIDVTDSRGVLTTTSGTNRVVTTTLAPLRATRTTTTFEIDVNVGLGHVEVDRAQA